MPSFHSFQQPSSTENESKLTFDTQQSHICALFTEVMHKLSKQLIFFCLLIKNRGEKYILMYTTQERSMRFLRCTHKKISKFLNLFTRDIQFNKLMQHLVVHFTHLYSFWQATTKEKTKTLHSYGFLHHPKKSSILAVRTVYRRYAPGTSFDNS